MKAHLQVIQTSKRRFKTHCSWQYSRYNYAVAFGTDIYYMRITGREKEKDLESKAGDAEYIYEINLAKHRVEWERLYTGEQEWLCNF